MKKIYFLLTFILFQTVSMAAVSITAPPLTINTCTYNSTYRNLGDIVITEGAVDDIKMPGDDVAYTLILTAPTNFQFLAATGTVSVIAGRDITAISINVTSTTIEISFQSSEGNATIGNVNRINEFDAITISGIQVRATAISASVNILRTAANPGTGTITGITNGTTSFASLSSAVSCGCNHTLRMTDTYGDGWNGGTVSVSVNGVDVLTNVTIASGAGPNDLIFTAASGDVIRVYETAAGSYDYEMRVEVFDGGMTSIIGQQDPVPGTTSSGGSTGAGNCPPPMAISSATVTQSATTSVSNCSSNVQIIRLEITTTGVTSPRTLTQIQTRFTGTASIAGITSERVYFTGNSATFSTTTLFGTGVPSTATHNINGLQNLVSGVNYFWLVYDVNSSALITNTIDGEISQFTATAIDYNAGSTPSITVTNPAGSRTLTLCLAPGGVGTGLETWIRADIGTTGTTPITAWANQNTSGTPVLINGSPNLNTASTSYNYNPYVDFTGPVGLLPNGAAANRQFLKYSGFDGLNPVNLTSMFFTFNLTDLTRANTHIGCVEDITFSAGPPNGSLHGHVNAGNAAIHESGYDLDFGVGSPANTWRRNGSNIVHDAIHSSLKHILSTNCTSGANTGINRLLGGQKDDGGGFAGHFRDWRGPVSEIIAYSTAITATDRQKIDSYLAIKYGITLTNNYLSTSGGIIFTTASPYDLNIIGIGRDDVEALTQKQSHQDDDSVRVYLNSIAATNLANGGSFTSDVSYVVIGANAGKLKSNAISMAEIPTGLTSCGIASRLEREWRVTRTNMAQNYNMDVKLNSTAAIASVDVSHLRLLVDDDGNFSNGGTQCFYNGDGTGLVFSYTSPTITISNISTAHIPNNATRFITIASINLATPLPVEIIEFEAKLNSKQTTDLTWETSSERDNDYFTIEKSDDALNWEFFATVNGASTSSSPLNYYLEDKNPFIGSTYYKLKQTDFNGSTSEIGIRKVNLISDEAFVLSPNPAKDKVSIVGSELIDYSIELFNNLGQKIQFSTLSHTDTKIELDLERLPAGVYYISLSRTDSSQILKLLIEN